MATKNPRGDEKTTVSRRHGLNLPFEDPNWKNRIAPGRLVPSNLPVLEAEGYFKKKLPKLLAPKVKEVTRFILEELVPMDIAVDSGYYDAREIGKTTIDENLDISPVHLILSRLAQDSMELKLLSFVSKTANLNDTESKLLVAKYLMRTAAATGVGGSDLVKQIMSALQPISSVQRQTEERPPLVREVSATRRTGRRKSASRPSPRTKG